MREFFEIEGASASVDVISGTQSAATAPRISTRFRSRESNPTLFARRVQPQLATRLHRILFCWMLLLLIAYPRALAPAKSLARIRRRPPGQ